ncbi:hypothetical protein [Bradyrhizobium centrolobii]|uniref:hypothetical protein n=1 Tax=Bradyrhizobium centrolobii TaxID=1505087 RepID=UPI0010A971CF|nr:hypothetical protein [Bradyrhizobium centrolobii]
MLFPITSHSFDRSVEIIEMKKRPVGLGTSLRLRVRYECAASTPRDYRFSDIFANEDQAAGMRFYR